MFDKKSPFLEYGIAIENYFFMEKWLIWSFSAVCFFAIFQMDVFIFASGGYREAGLFSHLTFANLGQTSNVCSKTVADPSKTTVTF